MSSCFGKVLKKPNSRTRNMASVEPKTAGTNTKMQCDMGRVNSASCEDILDAELFHRDPASWFARAAIQYKVAMAIRLAHVDPSKVNLMDILGRVEAEYSGKAYEYSPNQSGVLNPGIQMFKRLKGVWTSGDVEALTGFGKRFSRAIHRIITVPYLEEISELRAEVPLRCLSTTDSVTISETIAGTSTTALTPQTTPSVAHQKDAPQQPVLVMPVNLPTTSAFEIHSDCLPPDGGVSLPTRTNSNSTNEKDRDNSIENCSPTSTSSCDSLPPSPVVGSKQDLSRYMVILELHSGVTGHRLEEIEKVYVQSNGQFRYEGNFNGVSAVGLGRSSKIAKYLAVKQICEELDLVRGS